MHCQVILWQYSEQITAMGYGVKVNFELQMVPSLGR